MNISGRKTFTFALMPLIAGVVALWPGVAFAIPFIDFSFTELMANLGNAVMSLFGALLGVAGLLLNATLEHTVFNMSSLLGSGSSSGLSIAWTLLRDAANVAFIFILIFIGIATILSYEAYGDKQVVVRVIIAALLVNFSLFFTQIVVDASNLLAFEVYELIEYKGSCENTQSRSVCINEGISGAFMEQLDLTTLYDVSQTDVENGGASESILGGEQTIGNIILVTMLGSIFLIIAAFVIFAAALMLIGRFVTLAFLMIISPVALAATILPATRTYWNQWFTALLSQSFFAPLFLVFIWASLHLMQGFGNEIGENGNFAAALTGNASTGEVFVSFALAAGLIFASLILAKKLGIRGAETASSYGKRLIGATTVGAAGRLGRTTIGRGASFLAGREVLKERAAGSGIGGFAARATLRGLRGTAGSTFDARRVGGAGKALGIGEGIKGGYDDVLKRQTKAREDFSKKEIGTSVVQKTDQAAAEAKYEELLRKAEEKLSFAQYEGNAEETQKAQEALTKLHGEKDLTIQGFAEEAAGERARERQKKYAQTLATEKTVPFGVRGFKVARKNKESAETIRDTLTKSKDARLLDAIKNAARTTTEGEGGEEN